MNKKQIISFAINEDLDKKLEKCAKEVDRSKGYCIRKALERYLQENKAVAV